MRISDWSSDVCSSDLRSARKRNPPGLRRFSFLCYLPANGFRKRRSKRPAQGVVVNREERMKQATLIAASAVFALSAASMATASPLDDVKGKEIGRAHV